jgi:uncharacterized protein YbjT (DUF2867 family)
MKNALVVGSSGLVGSSLLKLLLVHQEFSAVLSLVRKPSGIQHEKLKEIVVDFDRINTFSYLMKADILYCCLGTTIRNAGSRSSFAQVDLEYVTELARIAERNRIRSFIVISSVGAHPYSRNFYLRTKGEMERQVMACEIQTKYFIRPGLILGDRKEFRFGEWAAAKMSGLYLPLLIGTWRKYRPVTADKIASCMLNISLSEEITEIIENDLIEYYSAIVNKH